MTMDSWRILVIGSGGREHAIAHKLAASDKVSKVYVAPGNGGTASMDASKVENVPLTEMQFTELVDFAISHQIDMVVPGSEAPLCAGIADKFYKHGIPCFGPSKDAAQLENSKILSKQFMTRHHIPTSEFDSFTNSKDAIDYACSRDYDVVIKADGLCQGKGVILPSSKDELRAAITDILDSRVFGESGSSILVEKRIYGQELSILTFSDGYTAVSLPAAQDHKRAFDNDEGLNTGGMGSYAPAPICTPELFDRIHKTVVQPTIDGLRREKTPFRGVLFTGIMIDDRTQTPYVLEYNIRFGDPETQSLLLLLDTDLAEIMMACCKGCLDSLDLKIKPGFACTVVIAAQGYPLKYEKGHSINLKLNSDVTVFHAGTKLDKNETSSTLVTNGGRVLAVSGHSDTVRGAIEKVYRNIDTVVNFQGMFYRHDIGKKALNESKPDTELQNSQNPSLSYEEAGVSVDAGNEFVNTIKALVAQTSRPGSRPTLGGFGAVFDLAKCNFRDPLIVSATDGVGTKLLLALKMKKYDTVGQDLVAMNVNDLIAQGAEPLFFLDYYATGKLEINQAVDFLRGVVQGCKLANCALVGGETSEMPGMYDANHFDVNGTSVGAVERDSMLPMWEKINAGDILIGIASAGPHSNGYSLIRKIIDVNKIDLEAPCPWDKTQTIGENLLIPTKIYVKPVLALMKKNLIKSLAHITGGGLVENVPRAIPESYKAVIDGKSWPQNPVFQWLQKSGNITDTNMYRTFNMGIGMVLVVEESNALQVCMELEKHGEEAYNIGHLELANGDSRCMII